MIKTIISDLGGVFLNRGIWLFWDYLNTEFNIPVEKGKTAFLSYYKEFFSGKIQEEEFWKSYLTDISLDKDWKELRTVLLNLFAPNEGMVNLYKKLKEKGYKMVLLSDQTMEWWPFLDEKFGISAVFDEVVISAKVGLHKPNPAIYEYALKVSDTKAENALFIDDLETNLVPAAELGINTLFFVDPKQLVLELKKREIIENTEEFFK